MTTFYFVGGEDECHYQVGGGTITTTATNYRSTSVPPLQPFARCALALPTSGKPEIYWASLLAYTGTPSTFWWSGRFVSNAISSIGGTNATLVKFVDALGFVRLRLRVSAAAAPPTIIAEKVNTAGSATALTNTLAPWGIVSSGSGLSDKVDIFWDNQASGTLNVYLNGVRVIAFTGDTTTETTAITGHQISNCWGLSSMSWSEIICSDTDTRSMSLQTLQPVANGNTHNFDTGSPAAANVNETTLNDTTLDGSTTAGQIDQYTIPALVSGTYTIMDVIMSARFQIGTSGPTKVDLGVRSTSTDYWSSDFTGGVFWQCIQYHWLTDPATSVTWQALPSNIGLKSVT